MRGTSNIVPRGNNAFLLSPSAELLPDALAGSMGCINEYREVNFSLHVLHATITNLMSSMSELYWITMGLESQFRIQSPCTRQQTSLVVHEIIRPPRRTHRRILQRCPATSLAQVIRRLALQHFRVSDPSVRIWHTVSARTFLVLVLFGATFRAGRMRHAHPANPGKIVRVAIRQAKECRGRPGYFAVQNVHPLVLVLVHDQGTFCTCKNAIIHNPGLSPSYHPK